MRLRELCNPVRVTQHQRRDGQPVDQVRNIRLPTSPNVQQASQQQQQWKVSEIERVGESGELFRAIRVRGRNILPRAEQQGVKPERETKPDNGVGYKIREKPVVPAPCQGCN